MLQIKSSWSRSSACGYHSYWFGEVWYGLVNLLVWPMCLSVRSLSLEGQTWLERKDGLEIGVWFWLIEWLLLLVVDDKIKCNGLICFLIYWYVVPLHKILRSLSFSISHRSYLIVLETSFGKTERPNIKIPWLLRHCMPAFTFHFEL